MPACSPRRLTIWAIAESVMAPKRVNQSAGRSMRRWRSRRAGSGPGPGRSERRRTGPGAAAPADHDRDGLVEVDVGEHEVRQLGPAHTGVEEEPDDGGIPAGVERLAVTAGQQRPLLLLGEHRHGTSGRIGGFMRAIGETVISSSSTNHPKNTRRSW